MRAWWRRLRRRAGLGSAVVLASGALAGQLLGQGQVRVVDGGGAPVPATRIEVYGFGELLHVLASDADGVVILPSEGWSDVRRLSLSHLGFQTLIVQSYELDGPTTLQLEPSPVGLEGLEVEVAGNVCPLDDAPEARRLWAEVARRYSADTGQRRLSADYRHASGSVLETTLRFVNEASMTPAQGSNSPTAGRRGSRGAGPLEMVVRRDGYSWEPARMSWGMRDLNRVYPAFELWHAYHFATSTFGELHDFSVVRSRGESTLLAFCPKASNVGTRIMGTLEVVADSHFSTANWRFLADDPDEDAGGEVRFVAYREGRLRLPHLLSEEGLFYRHSGRPQPFPDLPRAYYREAVSDVDWQVLPPGRSR